METKSAQSSAEDERSRSWPAAWIQDTYVISSAARLSWRVRTRSFASPDCSGFALSELFLSPDVYRLVKTFLVLQIKKHSTFSRRWVLLEYCLLPEPKMFTHLFGNPAVLNSRTRGFASPDRSGFALSEIFFTINIYRNWLFTHFHFDFKGTT